LKETGGDVQEAIDCTYYTAGEGRRLHGYTTPAEMPDKFAMCVRQPVGLCGLISPWNFPMAIPSWKLIPALVCGNTVVIKPAEDTPLSTINLVKACEEAGCSAGCRQRRHGLRRRGRGSHESPGRAFDFLHGFDRDGAQGRRRVRRS
jgi:aldehyde dehydrogenase (NAD+)